MSFASGFRFKDYACDASMYDRDAQVSAVTFSVYTSRDIECSSVVTVNTPHHVCEPSKPWDVQYRKTKRYGQLLQKNSDEYVTLFDPRMGNVDCGPGIKMHCTTCRSIDIDEEGDTGLVRVKSMDDDDSDENPRCTGHYGKIDLPIYIIHPLMLKETLLLLRSMCWKCSAFRIAPELKKKITNSLCALMEDNFLDAEKEIDIALSKIEGSNISETVFTDAFSTDLSNLDSNEDFLCSTDIQSKLLNQLSLSNMGRSNIHSKVRAKVLKAFFALGAKKCPYCGYKKPVSVSYSEGILYYEPPLDDLVLMQKLNEQNPGDVVEREATLLCLHPGLLRFLFTNLMQGENAFLSLLYGRLFHRSQFLEEESPFLIKNVLVPPNNTRSWQRLSGKNFAIVDQTTEQLSSIITLIEDFFALTKKDPSTKSFEKGYKQIQLMVNRYFMNTINSFLKKSGTFRSNMMGKRTNQACRTVISPDAFLPTNALSLSTKLASRLTFPESLAFTSDDRREFLIQCIRNGTSTYPGATHLEVRLQEGNTQTISLKGKEKFLSSIADRMQKNVALGCDVIVHRHIINGDMVILNRQPTLHKSSMLGQRAVVSGNNYTMRFHYANCKGFNADFDGDEMNCHVPQGMKCHTELKCLMDAESHYFSASSGKPIRGLIQDHLVAAYRLTSRDRFLTREDFVSFLYEFSDTIKAVPLPCIVKPQMLWSGKQLFSECIKIISGIYDYPLHNGLTLVSRCTTNPRYFCYKKGDKNNAVLHVHRSELLTGVLDSSNLGLMNKSLVHYVHDTYGSRASGRFLANASRLLTAFMKRFCLTIKISDLCIDEDVSAYPEQRRTKMLDALDIKANISDESTALRMISEMHTKLNESLYPHKTLIRFPHNNLMLMTAIGARGSYSNAYQMMIALGQQYFDSKRISVMPSGKVLPGTLEGDRRAKCHGFVKGRFISGIRPQEYFIHASAGRDGIIDTAVKTARSGYLQRCLIKGMESSCVQWDGSVHNGEGEIVQFKYGADGRNPSNNIINNAEHVRRHADDFAQKWFQQSKDGPTDENQYSDAALRDICESRSLLARCEPGEPVGLIAAQSLGEPSTQMTLNTFHHTGSTSSHVTEGIPRVRELLSFSTKNPLVTLPITCVQNKEVETCNRLKNLLLGVTLDAFLSSAARSPYNFDYSHSSQGSRIDISLLFSNEALDRRKQVIGYSDEQFQFDFIQSLISLFKNLVSKVHKNISREDVKAMHTVDAAEEDDLDGNSHGASDDNDGENEDVDTHSSFTDSFTQTEVETDFVAEKNDDRINEMSSQDNFCKNNSVQESLTQWTRPSIRLSKVSRKSKVSVVMDNLCAHSYLRETDSFEVTCSLHTPSYVAMVIQDLLQESLRTTPLQNSFLSFGSDLSICELYREKGSESGILAFQGKSATLANVRTLSVYIPLHLSFDWNALQSSDPKDLADSCGIEAGRIYLEKELNRLFQGYSVDFRHTMLVADTVSHTGTILPYSRNGLVKVASASPFLQMTFETGGIFLYECLKNTNYDALRSFSSSLIVGNRPTVGTNFGKLAMVVEA